MRGEVGCGENEDEQILTSAEHAGVVGGLICTRALLRWANEKQLISCKHDETMLDEYAGWLLAAFGVYFQVRGLPD